MNNRSGTFLTAMSIFLSGMVLTGCLNRSLSSSQPDQPTGPSASPSLTGHADLSVTPQPSPTGVLNRLVETPPTQPAEETPPPQASTPVGEPTPLTFSTSTPSAVSTWRPPVYPLPWAPNPSDHFYFGRPIAADDIDSPFSDYGYGDMFFDDVVHTGIDIPGEIGTPIHAAGDGKVIWTGYGYYRGGSNILDDPYGKAVAIKHSFGYQTQPLFTVYAHLDEINVQNGQFVQTGDVIGKMGETGHATGPHLHFEVRLGEDNYFATRNPNLWLSPPQGWGLLVGEIRTASGRLMEGRTIYVHSELDPELQNTASDRLWIARTYRNEAINPDPYYQENLVVPDLPAGLYRVNIPMREFGLIFEHTIEIRPGQVTYLQFQLWDGFQDGPPPTPEVEFTPAP